MPKAWLVRPVPHGHNRINEFKTKNIIAIGWPLIGNLLGKSRSDMKNILQNEPYNLTGLSLGNAYPNLDILVNQMNLNDLVLIPNGDDIYFGKIDSDYIYDKSKDSDDEGYPHQRKIVFLHGPISRSNLPNTLRSSLKSQRTISDLSKHYDIIKQLSEGKDASELVDNNNGFIDIEYPIRPNLSVKITLPEDINESEANRLGDFIKTVYFK
ncbi:restriction endonuclease [Romboutsia lituseburensis]|uniref:restriction endonuclease n=1 Tax=Romboutsia lituseburensis TaxID=1537 RepID=UPI00215AD1D6|nr:hypothetical protein [Romboutsia lituseburensis]MCR8747222.1 hypothetical protein [Romboutsia lituseburensis]